jgi:hypothetical protein
MESTVLCITIVPILTSPPALGHSLSSTISRPDVCGHIMAHDKMAVDSEFAGTQWTKNMALVYLQPPLIMGGKQCILAMFFVHPLAG